ncbi:MAG: WD40 repeat domain-containing protein, partial [Scytonema sp. PMC 1070.18]|nr:WD40 repeat domain-containing protein [Scytonema sp. PMC 1070.18]
MVKTLSQKLIAKSPAYQRARLAALPNLVKSDQPDHLEKYFQILTDFEFIAEKIQHPNYGVDALIIDYDLINYTEVENHSHYNREKVKALKLIQGALKLSAHIVCKDRTQLSGQLWGRLLSFQIPEIQAMLLQIKKSKTAWLRLLTPSLTPPGGRLLRTLSGHSYLVNAVAVTPDGKQVISGSGDKTLNLWNLENAQEVYTLIGHSGWVNAVTITLDGKQAISGSRDYTLKVWNLETAQEMCTLTGHNDWVNAVAVTPNGKQVISGSGDKTLKVWNLETAQEICTLCGHHNSVNAVAVTPNGKQVISASWDKTL